jgi:hypothetical protein
MLAAYIFNTAVPIFEIKKRSWKLSTNNAAIIHLTLSAYQASAMAEIILISLEKTSLNFWNIKTLSTVDQQWTLYTWMCT